MEYTTTVYKGNKITAVVNKPVLTEEEYEKRLKQVKDSAQEVMKAAMDAEKAKSKGERRVV